MPSPTLKQRAAKIRAHLRDVHSWHVVDIDGQRWMTDSYLAVNVSRPEAAAFHQIFTEAGLDEFVPGTYMAAAKGVVLRTGDTGANLAGAIDGVNVDRLAALVPFLIVGHHASIHHAGYLLDVFSGPEGAQRRICLNREYRHVVEELTGIGVDGWLQEKGAPGTPAVQVDGEGRLVALLMPVTVDK